MKHIVRAFLNLIYPLRCPVCKKALDSYNSGQCLCDECWGKISLNPSPYCLKCGKPLLSNNICNDCRQEDRYYFQRAWSVGLYEGVLKRCILLIKYHRKLCLIKPLGQLMLDFVRHNLDINSIDFIVPVPLHRVKTWERGFNQAHLLADILAKGTGISIAKSKLKRRRHTSSQSRLSKKERRENVRGAFRVKDKHCFAHKSLLLIDDVFTTGATASECAYSLKKAGAKKVEVLTLARGK